MPSNIIVLSDRIKELSNTLGTTNMQLEGAAVGFSAFGDFYSHDDLIFYAITDGTNYEIGSGQYQENTYNELVRFPFRSTNGDGLVSWTDGVKEIYVTYPATHSVYTASGLDVGYNAPQASGLAFWESEHILNYDSGMVWDSTNKRIGLNQSTPVYAIEIGGEPHAAIIHASGFITDSSGVFFPSGNSIPAYSGGRQVEHFLRNELDPVTGTSSVFQLSGVVDERLLFQKQAKGHVLAGPPSGCGDGCSPDYPSFRYLTLEDLPDLSSLYVVPHNSPAMSGVAFWHESGVLSYDPYFVYNTDTNYLGINIQTPLTTLDVGGSTNIRGNLTVSGNADVHGTLTYINSNTVTLGDKNLELGSLSGVAMGDDSLIDGGGITVLSTDGNKEWKWINATDAWTTAQKIDVSGIVGLQAGSGLTLRENSDGQLLLLDIDDMFTLIPDGGSPSYVISQDDKIVVSGVKGITTTITSDGTTHSVIIDPTALSGQLVSEITTAASPYNYWIASGDIGNGEAIVNYDHVYFSGGDNVETTYYASYLTGTNVLAIDASGYIAAPGSGIGLATSAYGPSGQFYLDDPASLTGGQINESDIVTQSAFEMLIWDDSASIWKYITIEDLQDEIDTGAGAGEANEHSFKTIDVNDTDSGFTWGTADVVAETTTDTVKLVAGANITLASDATNDAIRITAGAASSDTADSGIIKVGTEFRMEPDWLNVTETGDPARFTVSIGAASSTWYDAFGGDGVDWGNDFAIAIGNSALADLKQGQYSIGIGNAAGYRALSSPRLVAIGMSAGNGIADSDDLICLGSTAGMESSGCDFSTFIGYYAGREAIESPYSVMIGRYAGYHTTGTDYTNMIGHAAGYESLSCDYANMIGYGAGTGMDDCNYVDVMGYQAGGISSGVNHSVLLGYQAGYNHQTAQWNNMIGYGAGTQATGTDYTNMIGYEAGKDSLSCDYTNMIGYKAGYSADDCNYSEMIGHQAGMNSSGCSSAVMIGREAGGESEGLNGISIGKFAGYQCTGVLNSTMIGESAGSHMLNIDQGVFIGYGAGYLQQNNVKPIAIGNVTARNMNYSDQTIAMGHFAGYYASGCNSAHMIGQAAGSQATGCNQTVMLGHFAGSIASEDYVTPGDATTDCQSGVFIGSLAGATATQSSNLVAIGTRAGTLTKSASGVMIGHLAGYGAGTPLRTEGAFERGGSVANAVFIGSGVGHYVENSEYITLIGADAGSGIQNSSWLDVVGYAAGRQMHNCSGIVAIGRSAGRQAGTKLTDGSLQIGDVDCNFFGRFAGKGTSDCHEVDMLGYKAGHEATGVWQQVCIGSQAGLEMDGAQSGVFIGYRAGKQNKGVYNLSILANGATEDLINKNVSTHSKFNIANVIAGDHSDGDTNLGSTFPYKKRVSIGIVDKEPSATLQITPADTVTTQLTLAPFTSVGSQSNPMMVASSISRSYNGTTGNTENHVIDRHGFLRLPIYAAVANLPSPASDHDGEMAIYLTSGAGSAGVLVYNDGTNWKRSDTGASV